jgi:hypothetical protein
MTPQEALSKAEGLIQYVGYETPDTLNLDSFPEYATFVADIAKELSPKAKSLRPWLKEWAEAWRKLYDEFDKVVQADPMVLYRPKHEVAHAFHSSLAFIRYYRGGNGTSKTQSGYAEHYFTVTGQHRWRTQPIGDTFIVGLAFSKYAPGVFEKKFLTGETNNILSPIFPEGGKWFNHYDPRKHIITVGCRDCAEKGKAGSCRHLKRSITLFSDEGGWEVLQGRQDRLGHFDEHVRREFYHEAIQRVARVPHGSLIITGTPLFGLNSWENEVAHLALGDPKKNRHESGKPVASLHKIDQFAAGIVDHAEIRQAMKMMNDFEIKARVYGEPSPMTQHPVFDQFVLQDMHKAAVEPSNYSLATKEGKSYEEVASKVDIEAQLLGQMPESWSGLRVWDAPTSEGQYLIAVDTARGLTHGDASCASVIRLQNAKGKLRLELVAQYHGWINAFDYGNEVFTLAVWYNDALVVTELTGGFGDAVNLRLKQIGYWNIFRDLTSYSQASFSQDPRFGVDTNAATKPFMVAALQQFIRDRTITVPCRRTIEELVAFEQQNTTKDGRRLVTPKYQGAGGAYDDRVMSLVIGASVAVSHPVFDFAEDAKNRLEKPTAEDLSPEWQQIHKELETPDPGDYMGMAE